MAAIILIMAIIATGAVTYAYVSSQTKAGSVVTIVQTTTPVNSGQTTYPSLGVTLNTANTLTAASITEVTPAYNFYSCSKLPANTQFSAITTLYGISPTISALTKGTQAVTKLGANDLTCGYGVLTIYAGTLVYPDVNKIFSGGQGVNIASYKWMPTTTLGRNDLAVQVLYSALGSPNYAISPNLAFGYTLAEFVQTTAASVTVTNGYASSTITGIGDAANTNTVVKWTMAAVTSNDAIMISKVLLNSNQSTSSPVITPGQFTFGDNVPAFSPAVTGTNFQLGATGALSGISFGNVNALGYASATSTFQWQYWPGLNGLDPTQMSNGILVANPAQTVGDTTFNFVISSSFASGGHVSLGLSVTLIAGTGALTTVATSTITLHD